jgi:site-specific recombinase XerD
VPQLLDAYLQRLATERNLSPLTLRNYRTDLEHYVRWLAAEGIDPLAIDRRTFRRYLASVDGAGTARGSVARKVSTIHTFYRRLVQDGLLPADPLHGVRPPKQERRLPKVIADKAVTDLVAVPVGEGPSALRDRAILEVLYAAGLRVSELAGLNVADVNMDEWTLRVTGKGNKQRIALFGEPAARALRAYLHNGRPKLASGKAEAALFLNRDGGRLSVRAVQLMVRRSGVAAGIEAKTHPHLLRHSFATHMLDGGADVRVVQELLGHARATTTQIYTHVTEARQREVYDQAFYNVLRPRRGRKSAGGTGKEPQAGNGPTATPSPSPT